ncbi:DoxX family protein [Methylobacterium haplocladii]|uniref:DoxX family protein n=1 Tax=Methylobacterium haplocladii TaxID=1176176 RepID=A0A512IL63_9HYPH|nr:DoxX family protein [Methylobacterium haplocladii]GEO98460.1 hypothetical protein MHA02_08480 [Methylobacterium haplocladii]GJD86360.1 hypothetical protein HPGCJGGD_4266 [Methylobacterium haplocladii]GLS60960.1 hypothetical protein GCM10007887_36520 [Methylobacterium haplocladii]
MNAIVRTFIDSPERLSRPLLFLGPLAARIVVGWVFLWSGWTKLHNLPQMIQNFSEWGIPYPEVMTPFVSGVEFVGGLLLLLGLFTRIAAPMLVVVMVVATIAAKLDQADSLETLLGFEEVAYMALFGWLGVAGPGPVSLDHLLQRMTGSESSIRRRANPSSQSEPARV